MITNRPLIYQIAALTLLGLVISFLMPLLLTSGASGSFQLLKRFLTSDFVNSLLKSLSFAVFQSLLTVTIGIFFAILLHPISWQSSWGKLMSLLLVPTLLGNVSVAFSWKVMLFNTVATQSGTAIFTYLSLIQLWQFGTLFIYIFWLGGQFMSSSHLNYSSATNLSSGVIIKDIYLASIRQVAILLFLFSFIFNFYEDAKLEFVFKASRGTNSELVSHFLNRRYYELIRLSPSEATLTTTFAGLLCGLSAVFVLWLETRLLIRTFDWILKSDTYSFWGSIPQNIKLANVLLLLFSCIILFPVVNLYHTTGLNWKGDMERLVSPLFFTLIAALIATLIAITGGVFSRLGWIKTLSTFSVKSLPFFLVMISILLLPPLLLLLTGYEWMGILGEPSEVGIKAVWVFGHVALTLPLLVCFMFVSHFKVKSTGLTYAIAQRFPFLAKVKDFFFIPTLGDYVFTFIIAFGLIWNESVINSVLSDFIPSFVSEVNKTVSGRAADYSVGVGFFTVSLVIALFCSGLWTYSLSRSKSTT